MKTCGAKFQASNVEASKARSLWSVVVLAWRGLKAIPVFFGLWRSRYDSEDIPPEYRHDPERVPFGNAWRYAWHVAGEDNIADEIRPPKKGQS